MKPPDDQEIQRRLQDVLASYRHWFRQDLCGLSDVWTAPFAVLAQGAEDPPQLWYGNNFALRLWRMELKEMRCMSGSETAEPELRAAREEALARVRENGYEVGYSGIRVTSRGERFEIENGHIWNVLDGEGEHVGQAARFCQYRWV